MPNEEILLEMTLKEEDLYIGTGVDYFYYLDEALYAEIMPRLQAYAMQVTEWKDTRIVGQVTTDADHSLIYTSIPYDEGWNVTVDGEAVEIVRVCGALLAVDVSDLPEGEHTVELSYMPKCYVYAFILSMGGILLLILCMAIRISVHKFKERNRDSICCLLAFINRFSNSGVMASPTDLRLFHSYVCPYFRRFLP